MRGPLLIGVSLVLTLTVAGTLLVVAEYWAVPTVELAEGTDELDESVAEPSDSTEYTVFSDDHVTFRYPRDWKFEDVTDHTSDVVTKYLITAPDGEHQICFYVSEVDDDLGFRAREHHERRESEVVNTAGVSEWRRTGLREEASGPGDMSVSELEATYTATSWDRPDRWMRWRLGIAPEQGRETSLQFMVPASDRTEYEDVADEVFASFQPVS